MNALRVLAWTVGVVLAAVVLLLGILLSPVLLLLAPVALLVWGAFRFWRVKHKTERGRRRVGRARKKAEKALHR